MMPVPGRALVLRAVVLSPYSLFRSSDIVVETPLFKSASELQPAFARAVGQRLDAAMEKVPATVKDHVCDPRPYRTLGDQLADLGGRLDIGASLQLLAETLVEGRRRRNSLAVGVVDDLRVDLLGRAEN